jgi:hypothetical protein
MFQRSDMECEIAAHALVYPLTQNVMRRCLAIPMVLLFLLPLVSAMFGASDAEAGLPACCRRDGKHHCAMLAAPSSPDKGVGAIRGKCPYSPAALTVVILPSFAPSTAAAIFAGVVQHTSVAPQTDARGRVSYDRSRQKRGPPSLLA